MGSRRIQGMCYLPVYSAASHFNSAYLEQMRGGAALKIKYHSISRARISSGFMVLRSVDNACYKAQGLGFQAGLRCTMTYFYLCCISHLETLSKQSLPYLWTAVIPRAISPYQITSYTHKRTSTTPFWQENTIHILSQQKRRTIIYNDVTNTGFHVSTIIICLFYFIKSRMSLKKERRIRAMTCKD